LIRLRDVGEHAWLARVVARLGRARAGRRVIVGPGDDAAVVRPGRRPLLVTTDALVEGVHFQAGRADPAALGRRAFAVNASDLAAMGGVPRFALLALESPGKAPVAALDALAAGFATAARRAGADVVGGNVTGGPHLAITAALIGEAPGRVVTRAGGRPGDVLYVTGTLGGAGLAVRRRLLPVAPDRTRAGVVLAGVASAMIDVSDGLLQDLGHLCRASRAGAELELARVPVAAACRRALAARAPAFAATSGEDYELLFAVAPKHARGLSALRKRLGCRVTRIGRLVRGPAHVRVLDAAGRTLADGPRGFDHFRR
jgi:thiamine-monophosphate kinase